MAKRIYKELAAEKNILFFSMFLMLIVQYALNIMQRSAHLCEDCIMDAFAWVSRNQQGTSYLIAMVTVIIMTKETYRPERALRTKRLGNIWIYNALKAGAISLVLAMFNLFGTYIVGRSTSDKWCIWGSKDSYCYFWIGKTIEDVNYGFIIFTFFLASFLGFWVSALLPLLTSWYQNSYLIGAFVCIVVNLFGEISYVKYDMLRDVSYENIYNGIDIRYQFIYPFLIILLLLVAGCFKNKRDFLTKISK